MPRSDPPGYSVAGSRRVSPCQRQSAVLALWAPSLWKQALCLEGSTERTEPLCWNPSRNFAWGQQRQVSLQNTLKVKRSPFIFFFSQFSFQNKKVAECYKIICLVQISKRSLVNEPDWPAEWLKLWRFTHTQWQQSERCTSTILDNYFLLKFINLPLMIH